MSPVLPDWLPPWAQLLIVIALAGFALAFLCMPFAVFGLKGRLSGLELQLEEARADLQVIAARLAVLATDSTARTPAAAREKQEEWITPAAEKQPEEPASPVFRPPGAGPASSAAPRAEVAPAASGPVKCDEEGYYFPPSAEEKPEAEPPKEPPQPSRVTYGFSTPRVSDAYEPDRNVLPELRSAREEMQPSRPATVQPERRMPWHEPASDRDTPSERVQPQAPGRGTAWSPPDSRTEPVLRWPSRRQP